MLEDIFGKDLKLTHIEYRHDLSTIRSIRDKRDFAIVAGYDNLVQALFLRLYTPKGELRELGHPDYGSRIHELIGRLNNASNRKLLELYCKEAVLQDPRVREIETIQVVSNPTEPWRVDVYVTVLPVESSKPINLVFPFCFEG